MQDAKTSDADASELIFDAKLIIPVFKDESRFIAPFGEHLSSFIGICFRQIVRNWHKGGRDRWTSDSLDGQMLRLNISVQELRTALAYGVDVDEKAADVANWAFIIQDNWYNNPTLKGLPPEKRFNP